VLQQTAVQVVNSIIKLPGVSPDTYVRQLCPAVLGLLAAATAAPPNTDLDLAVYREALATATILLTVVEEDKRAGMLAVVVSHCVALLNTAATGAARQLHSIALELLKKVGPLYPTEFKSVVAAAPILAQKMGEAIKAEAAAAAGPGTAAGVQQASSAVAAPKIALTMDFSAFG